MAINTPFFFGNFPGGDSEAWMRQYWNVWGDAMRAAGGGGAAASNPFGMPGMAPSGLPDWGQTLDWWSRWLHGGRGNANDLIERFNAQARNWFGQMQEVAAQFAGRDTAAADIVTSWKKALGATGENPFPEIFRAMRGRGMQDMERWMEDAAPYLQAWRQEMRSWLSLPAFGLSREHQELLQELAQAQLDYQQTTGAFNALMAKAGQRAFELFETKLSEHEEPGKAIASARALFDLWIDAAEEAYANIALSPEFRHAYGALTNAQMQLRSGIQKEVEAVCGLFGMPTRTEMDSAHRKIAELERQLRRIGRRETEQAQNSHRATPSASVAGNEPVPPQQAKRATPVASAVAPVRKVAAEATPTRRTVPKRSAAKRSIAKPSIDKKHGSKKTTAKKTSTKSSAAKKQTTNKSASTGEENTSRSGKIAKTSRSTRVARASAPSSATKRSSRTSSSQQRARSTFAGIAAMPVKPSPLAKANK